ncbi:serine hydroxymethyltransferase [Patescibacteria group bacterium]
MNDKQVNNLIKKEISRQSYELQLIPSENYTSSEIRKALGSIFTHKYSEGQVGKRYYEGNEVVDEIESLCKKRALRAFGLNKNKWHVNVQAYSGSIANLAVYNALIEPGDKIMGMYLFDGGHLSHGWQYKGRKISLSSKIYKPVYYHVDPKTGEFDYDEVKKIAKKERPKILISGGTAYPREINHKKLAAIAKSINAYYMADIAHEAGLVVGKANSSPFPYADVVTMTTHKTLRGPRGTLILCRKEFADNINRSVFPGLQGGPFNNNIAAIAVCLKEAQSASFKKYANQVVKNAKTLAKELKKRNFDLVSGGTDKHLILIDLGNKNIVGKYAARALKYAGITLNMNTIPSEPNSPMNPSGIRLGTPTVTTRGMKEEEMRLIAEWIDEIVNAIQPVSDIEFDKFEKKIVKMEAIREIRRRVKSLCKKFPLPK